MTTIALLVASNIFMTAAWYGHLRFRSAPLWLAIVVSWLAAWLWLGEAPQWNEAVAFGLVLLAVAVVSLR